MMAQRAKSCRIRPRDLWFPWFRDHVAVHLKTPPAIPSPVTYLFNNGHQISHHRTFLINPLGFLLGMPRDMCTPRRKSSGDRICLRWWFPRVYDTVSGSVYDMKLMKLRAWNLFWL